MEVDSGQANTQLTQAAKLQLLRDSIRAVQDFPVPGILFRDITPLFASPTTLAYAVDELARLLPANIDCIAGVEARGFMLGVPLAYKLGKSFLPIRKPGKLPAEKFAEDYGLEYGENRLEIHTDACAKGEKIWLIDDLLATGGSLAAAVKLIERVGGVVVEISVLIELEGLNGWDKLPDRKCSSVLKLSAS